MKKINLNAGISVSIQPRPEFSSATAVAGLVSDDGNGNLGPKRAKATCQATQGQPNVVIKRTSSPMFWGAFYFCFCVEYIQMA